MYKLKLKTDNETANGNKEMSIGGSGFSLHRKSLLFAME
jgi:hypothetical protein